MKQPAVILLFFLYISAPACFGAAVYESTLTVVIPPAASAESIQTGKNSTVINPKDGTHTGLEAVFNIKTNGDDSVYDFILSGTINTNQGDTSGCFIKDGKLYIMLANTAHPPDISAISNLISNTGENKNLIAYEIFDNSGANAKYINRNGIPCKKIECGGKENFSVHEYILQTPYHGSYSIQDDSPGIYEAVMTFNIYRKP